MCCDGLESPECAWAPHSPNFPPEQIHVVMWEKQCPNPVLFPATEAESYLSNVRNEVSLKFGELP